uniref:Protein-tyrosine sulfotransferase n=1 Tax=Graphocephala atropunctata TaxID=36148 RepID=A0A1B6MNI1_9HEMI
MSALGRAFLHCKIYQVISLVFVQLIFLLLFLHCNFRVTGNSKPEIEMEAYSASVKYTYNRMSPLIFVGGFPRSGTTLMRAILDAHPDVRCGSETRVIPKLLQFRQTFFHKVEVARIKEAGVTVELLDRAMATFILDVIVHHGEAAPRLCSKDPFVMSSAKYVSRLFPRAKMVFMVRDGRASMYSAITRNVTIGGFDFNNIRSSLEEWNKTVGFMYKQCGSLGPSRCMMVHYEQLVLHPAHWMKEVLAFLRLPWDDAVLHHESHINKSKGVPLSRFEKSSDQIIKPINIVPLDKWVGFYSQDIVDEMDQIAPMLAKLGYNPKANPPNYGVPDGSVLQNTKLVQQQLQFWKDKAKQLHIRTAMSTEQEHYPYL